MGQGHGVAPGDVLRPGQDQGQGTGAGSGGGGVEFVLELKVDDILDWLWEELSLPHLQPKEGGSTEDVDLAIRAFTKVGKDLGVI